MRDSSALAHPEDINRLPLLALLTANAISQTGNVITAIAIPWFVLQTTGSAAKTGITGFFSILPIVLAGFLGGAVVDRLGFRRASIVSDLASGATVALIPLLFLTIGLEFWQLLVLVFLGAFLDAPGASARDAMLPELAAAADMPIERATSLRQTVERSSRLLGAPLAGGLIALVGTANVLWIDAASFFVSAAVVWAAVKVHAASPAPTDTEPKGYWREIGEGVRFLWRDGLMRTIVIMVMLTNFLDAAFGGVVQPVYVKQVYGSALDLGVLVAANGGGAVLGAILFAAIGHRLPRHATFVVGFLLVAPRFFFYLLYPALPVLAAATFIFSLGAGPLNPIIDAVKFERIPAGMRGRAFGTMQAGAWAAMPFGILLGGFLTESLGVQPMLIGMGAAYLLITGSMAVMPSMRQMERRPKLKEARGAAP